MKQSKLLLTMLNGAGIGAIAMTGGALFSSDAHAGVSNTRHNMGSTQAISGANEVTETGEVCVFCHTPHASNTTTGAPPLWNKNLPNNTYSMYASTGSSTLDAANNSGSLAAGSTSLACLSCHDGTQALDNLINAPGSGGFNADGGGANGAAYTWSGSGVNSSGRITNGATNLGTDLRNDHPIGIAYCGGNTGSYSDGSTTGCRDGDFKNIRVTGSGSSAQYWVDTLGPDGATGGVAGTRQKSDMYLYTRDFGTSNFKPSVECGSCHDPHVESKATQQVAFLRVTASSSSLCLACHSK